MHGVRCRVRPLRLVSLPSVYLIFYPVYITVPMPISPCKDLGFKERCSRWGVRTKGGRRNRLGFAAHFRRTGNGTGLKSQVVLGDQTPRQEEHNEQKPHLLCDCDWEKVKCQVTCLGLKAYPCCHGVTVGKSLCSPSFRLTIDSYAILVSCAYTKSQQIWHTWHNFHWKKQKCGVYGVHFFFPIMILT